MHSQNFSKNVKCPEKVLGQLFLDNTRPMWIYRVDNLQIIEVNQAAVESYGYTYDEFTKLTLYDIRTEEERYIPRKVLAEIDQKTLNDLNVHHKMKNGNVGWVNLVSLPLIYKDEECRLVIIHDLQRIKEYEAEIAKRTSDLQKVLDNSLDVICAFNSNGIFIQCSQASEDIWGYKSEELLGTAYIDYIIEDDHNLTREVSIQIMAGVDVTNFQNRYKRKDGSMVTIVWSARWDSKEQTMFCIARDATELINAERLATEQSQRVITVLESITDGFFTVDRNWVVTYWNSEAERMLRMPRSQILHKNLWEVYADAISLKFYSEYHRSVDESIPVNFEEYFPQLDIWLDVNAYPSSEGLSVYFKDITERVRSEAIIKETKDRYDLVNKATNDIIWDWNLITNVVEWNSAFETTLGYDLSIGKDGDWWIGNIHPEDRESIKNEIYCVINGTGTWSAEYRFCCANGTYKYFYDRGYLLYDENGLATRMIGSMQDITQLKKKEAQVIEHTKKILEIAHVNSHDVRKPLANILGIVELLQNSECDDERELIALLKASSKELDDCLRKIAEKTSQFSETPDLWE